MSDSIRTAIKKIGNDDFLTHLSVDPLGNLNVNVQGQPAPKNITVNNVAIGAVNGQTSQIAMPPDNNREYLLIQNTDSNHYLTINFGSPATPQTIKLRPEASYSPLLTPTNEIHVYSMAPNGQSTSYAIIYGP